MNDEIDLNNLPKHVAIIMDGNRRWAKKNGLTTPIGHKAGAENLKNIAKYANKMGIKYMTMYAFSTENWNRAQDEVTAIMKLMRFNIEDFFNNNDNNIKVRVIGEKENLPEGLYDGIKRVEEKSANNSGMVLNIAFNYGGRDEILMATKKIAKEVKDGKLSVDDINKETIQNSLYTANQPDPDLLIRTSGEERISNFLLWQLAYTEFEFTNKYWPEFTNDDFDEAIKMYQNRNRRFGGK